MPLLEQIETILRLLEAAKSDLEAWIEYVENEAIDVDTEDSENLISEIRSLLHEVGF